MLDGLTKKPINSFFTGTCLMILVLGLLIRFSLMPLFTYPFDIEHWAVIMQNMESGNSLFGLTGYFYTPVWGYILGFEDLFYNFLTNLGLYGERIDVLLPIEGMDDRFFTATTTTPAFNVAMKVPLILCDVVVGYLLYSVVKEEMNDTRKATIAFALWFLCPIVIYESSVQAMFDCFSALFVLLTLIFLRRSNYLLAGVMFANAALLKFFPAFCITIFIAYILKKEGMRTGLKHILASGIGSAVTVLVIFIPTMLDGTFENAFSFVFDRAGSLDPFMAMLTYSCLGITAIFAVLLPVLMMLGNEEGRDKNLILFTLLCLVTICSMNLGPQYCIVYIPLLAYLISSLNLKIDRYMVKTLVYSLVLSLVFVVICVTDVGFAPIIVLVAIIILDVPKNDNVFLVCFLAIGILSAVSGFFNNSLSILTSSGAYWNLFDLSSVMNTMHDWESIHFAHHNLPGFFIYYGEGVKLMFYCILMLALLLKVIRPSWDHSIKEYLLGRLHNE